MGGGALEPWEAVKPCARVCVRRRGGALVRRLLNAGGERWGGGA